MEFVRKVVGRNHGEDMARRQKIVRTNLNGKKELEKPKIKKKCPVIDKWRQSREED
jgi:hypothetical protein